VVFYSKEVGDFFFGKNGVFGPCIENEFKGEDPIEYQIDHHQIIFIFKGNVISGEVPFGLFPYSVGPGRINQVITGDLLVGVQVNLSFGDQGQKKQ